MLPMQGVGRLEPSDPSNLTVETPFSQAPVQATAAEVAAEAAAIKRVADSHCPVHAVLEQVVATASGVLVACWQVCCVRKGSPAPCMLPGPAQTGTSHPNVHRMAPFNRLHRSAQGPESPKICAPASAKRCPTPLRRPSKRCKSRRCCTPRSPGCWHQRGGRYTRVRIGSRLQVG